jgi:hypothetical protein
MQQIFDFYEGRGDWRSTLDAYPPDIVVAPQYSPICGKLGEVAWTPVYEDKEFVVYSKPGLSLPLRDNRAKSFAGVLP